MSSGGHEAVAKVLAADLVGRSARGWTGECR